jgi:hypothetical protein
MTPRRFAGRRSALIVGHPGHELRVWGWMRAVTPVVAVLTDGSGHGGQARLDLTREVCHRASARISDIFGVATDEQIYRAMLDQDASVFLQLSSRLATWLVDERIEVVAGDAIEGYNPTHDLCRSVIDRAVRLASREGPIDNYAFALVGPPALPAAVDGALQLDLEPEDLALKVAVCRWYAAEVGGTLFAEVEALFREHGERAFARESLVPVDAWAATEPAPDYRPFYETYGEKQVDAGHYAFVIRHREHVWPIARALQA